MGNRELMMAHNIEGLPSRAREEELIGVGQEGVYISISGNLAALFLVEVKADKKNTVNVVGVGVMDQADIDAISRAFKRAAAEMKAGRRNSKKDADALKSVLEKLSEIQSIVNGLLESELSDEQEAEAEADEAKANAEEPRGANAEEPEAKGADVDALLQQATEILTTKEG
jgi:hypothetical protein